MTKWQLQDAKNKFSALVNKAIEGEIQIIKKRGEEVAVLMSSKEYNRIISKEKSLKNILLDNPLTEDIKFDRSPATRDIEL